MVAPNRTGGAAPRAGVAVAESRPSESASILGTDHSRASQDAGNTVNSTVLITGAASQIGVYLLPALGRQNTDVVALTRNIGSVGVGSRLSSNVVRFARWIECDIGTSPDGDTGVSAEVLIHLAPLSTLPRLVPSFAARGGRRLIAFGSTGRYSKSHSEDAREQAFVTRTSEAESLIAALCDQYGIAWTIFRPTLVYGAGMDRNVALIAELTRRYRCFPLLGSSRGLRQPVHAADLAEACRLALCNPATFGKAYNLSGGETLSYLEMVRRIFVAQNLKPRFVRVPLLFFRIAMWSISRIPRYRDFNSQMARRMNDDLAFDHSEAARDFGYAPRPFQPESAGVKVDAA